MNWLIIIIAFRNLFLHLLSEIKIFEIMPIASLPPPVKNKILREYSGTYVRYIHCLAKERLKKFSFISVKIIFAHFQKANNFAGSD